MSGERAQGQKETGMGGPLKAGPYHTDSAPTLHQRAAWSLRLRRQLGLRGACVAGTARPWESKDGLSHPAALGSPEESPEFSGAKATRQT